ncbi:hypothetical protein ES703_125982 [subsurface metagenome]
MAGKFKHILVELKGHLPFTAFGAVLGISFMLFFRNVGDSSAHILFSIFHPGHVILSAIVTTSIFKIHASRKHFITILIIGYFGSVGIATVSDIIMPHIGSDLLGLNMPAHTELHQEDSAADDEPGHNHEHSEGIHFGFIEEWYLVNPAALIGILIGYFLPHTKFPHTGHILISTWASSAYLLMRVYAEINIATVFEIFVILFLSVWIPCVISDIIFPLIFVRPDIELAGPCPDHSVHSHPHRHIQEESD